MFVMKGGYDIVHFHGHSSYCVMPLVRKSGKIAVITVHQIESAWDNPKYNSFGQKVIKSMFVKGVREADRITTVANYLHDQIKAEFNKDSAVVPSGLAPGRAEQPRIINEKYGLRGKDYFLFLGRIDPVKRVDWMLDLVPHLKALRKSWRIIIAGGAQDSTTGAYLRHLQAAGSEEGMCVFSGPVEGLEKAELLSNCLGFIMPSAKEGLPITLLEAMSYGRCCLASDIPAHREVIEHGISGLLFNSLDKTDYVAKFNHLLSLPEERRIEIGRTAERYVKENFDWARTVDRLEAVYTDVLSDKLRQT
jgi:glycosyltransferase involved in cell wall biosynthesis